MIKARIENVNGSPGIVINGKVYPPMMAIIRTNNRGHMVIYKEYYRRLGNSGIKLFFLICDTEWLKLGAFGQFREEAEALLSVVPDAYIFPRIGLHPWAWWFKENPGETLSYSDGKKKRAKLYTESFEVELPPA